MLLTGFYFGFKAHFGFKCAASVRPQNPDDDAIKVDSSDVWKAPITASETTTQTFSQAGIHSPWQDEIDR